MLARLVKTCQEFLESGDFNFETAKNFSAVKTDFKNKLRSRLSKEIKSRIKTLGHKCCCDFVFETVKNLTTVEISILKLPGIFSAVKTDFKNKLRSRHSKEIMSRFETLVHKCWRDLSRLVKNFSKVEISILNLPRIFSAVKTDIKNKLRSRLLIKNMLRIETLLHKCWQDLARLVQTYQEFLDCQDLL